MRGAVTSGVSKRPLGTGVPTLLALAGTFNVSLLAAVVLYLLSVGSVRGFAFVLGLTTVIDVLVAFWFTHPIVVLLGRAGWMQRGSRWTGLDPDRLGAPSMAGAIARQGRRHEPKEVPNP